MINSRVNHGKVYELNSSSYNIKEIKIGVKYMNKNKLLSIFIFVALLGVLFSLSVVSAAPSNQSINASNQIDEAQKKINDLVSRNIPTDRINESLNQAKQIYSAQIALENTGKSANYKIVFQYLNDVSTIYGNAVEAQSQLIVFREELNKSSQNYDFSSIKDQLDALEKSYTEQRFEDTIVLINNAYEKMAEVESTQTKLRLFYSTATKTLKQFLIDNWKQISIISAVIIISVLVFWKTFTIWNIKRKIKGLRVQKDVLNELIKKLQYSYFKKGNISETEFQTKIETFKELMRDLDRKIPILVEQLAKKGNKGGYFDKKSKK